MLQGLKTVVVAVILSSLVGVLLGLFVAALVRGTTLSLFGYDVPKFLLAIAVMGFIGANVGFAFAYGFLPESPEE